jgi:hypothetical protein
MELLPSLKGGMQGAYPLHPVTHRGAGLAKDLLGISKVCWKEPIKAKSSRRGRLAPDLSHHRTYRSVYGGSFRYDVIGYTFPLNSLSLLFSFPSVRCKIGLHATLQYFFLVFPHSYAFCFGIPNVMSIFILVLGSFHCFQTHILVLS